MPLYDYHCKSCEESFSLRVKLSEHPPCPHCGSPHLDKLIAPCAFALKGASSVPTRENSVVGEAKKHVHHTSCGCAATSQADALIKKYL